MSAHEVLEQVKTFPPREWRRFFEGVYELEAALEARPVSRRRRRIRWPDGETPFSPSANGNKISVLPSGEARVRKMQSVEVEAGGDKRTATLYEVSGLGFTPNYLWLDADGEFLASVYDWSSVVRQGFEPVVPTLRESQRQTENARAAELGRRLTHKPSGDLVISNVTLFDSQSGTLVPNQRVNVHGERIVSVEPDRGQPPPSGTEIIDAKGKVLLPGLWDMHAHLFAENAFLDVATGSPRFATWATLSMS